MFDMLHSVHMAPTLDQVLASDATEMDLRGIFNKYEDAEGITVVWCLAIGTNCPCQTTDNEHAATAFKT